MRTPVWLRKTLDKWFWWRHVPRHRLDITPWFIGSPEVVREANSRGRIELVWQGTCTHPEFKQWCEENMPGRWRPGFDTQNREYVVLFKHEEDLIHFKLYWSEQLAAARR